jgi:hypothetical protein
MGVGHVGLDGVGQGVEAGVGREFRIHRHGGQGLAQGRVRDHGLADDGDLDLALGVVDDGELGDLGPGPGRGGHADQRRAGPLHIVHAFEFEHVAVVGAHDADGLGAVHGAAAAHGHDGVAALAAVDPGPGHDLVVAGIGGDVGEDGVATPASTQAVR